MFTTNDQKKSYGKRFKEKPFEKKRVFLAPSFFKENERRIENCKTLIVQLGKGVLEEDPSVADFVIVGAEPEQHFHRFPPTAQLLTWNQFIDLIPNLETASPPTSPKVNSSPKRKLGDEFNSESPKKSSGGNSKPTKRSKAKKQKNQ
jgi:hypothetical protein